MKHDKLRQSARGENRSLDTDVAEKIMGWKRASQKPAECTAEWTKKIPNDSEWIQDPHDGWWCLSEGGNIVPRYSSNIADAWEVVEKLHQKGVSIEILLGDGFHSAPYVVEVRRGGKNIGGVWGGSETITEAICRAALEAVSHG